MSRIGLAFSGGGIRSAAFCSGVLRRLLQLKVKIENMSCVSGGGFTGTAYLDWKYRNGQKGNPKWHKEFFNQMRERTGYFCNWQSLVTGLIDTVLVTTIIALVSVILPALIWMSYAFPLAYLVDFLVGDLLRATSHAHKHKHNVPNLVYQRNVLFASLLVTSVLSFIVGSIIPWAYIFRLISTSALVILALCVFPWAIHAILENAPTLIQFLVLILAAIVWLGFPAFRRRAEIVMVLFAYAFVIHFRVYKHLFGGLEYSDYTFHVLIWVSGILLWTLPFLGAIQQRLMNVFNRWRLQKAFYTPQSVGETGCSGIGWHDLILTYPRFISKERKILNLADFENISPYYICNTTVNNWKRTPDDEESYELLTLTPREIQRLDSPYEEDTFMDKLEPDDIRLSEAMALSAASLSPHLGLVVGDTSQVKHLGTDLMIIVGAAMGTSILSDLQTEGRKNMLYKILPLLMETLRALPLIVFPILYFVNGDEKWMTIAVFFYLGIIFTLSFIAMIPTGKEKPGPLEKLTRWFLINVPYVRFIRDMTGIINVGPSPPPVMRISDGGHTENLGLLPLLQLRLEKIVIANGTECKSDKNYGVELLHSLELARKKLQCSFTSLDGRDVMEDIRANFVDKKQGEQPRSYTFKVSYYSADHDDGIERMVGVGQILLLAPRHPSKGVRTKERVSWKVALRDIDVDLEAGQWGTGPTLKAEEVDRLTFCCCECCHGSTCRSASQWCCGSFPGHSNANQFFTPSLFSAYHREGYRACMEARAAEFLST